MLQSIINFVIAKELRIIMMHSTEIKSHLESLKSLYQKGLVSVMIGAGFSKNVCAKYPNWNELLSDLVIELYERSIITEYDMRKNSIPGFNVSFDDFKNEYIKEIIEQNGHTKLVSQYIRKKGYRESIEHYIEERIPYIDKTCNQLRFCGKNKGVHYSIIADDLKVMLLTRHLALKDIQLNINEIIEQAKILNNFLK